MKFSWKYINQSLTLAEVTPVLSLEGCWFALGEMGKSKLQHGVGGPVHYARYLSRECYYKVIF
jgi:hypothetical protein